MRQPKNRLATAALVLILCAGVLAAHAVSGASEKYFGNDGLKDSHSVELKIRGRKVSGVYTVVPHDNPSNAIECAFRGTSTRTKSGWLLKIYFKQGAPYQLASNTKRIVWRIGKRGNNEILIVPTYGKNYETNKYAAYEMEFEEFGILKVKP